jgi:Ca2+-binding RTX toxin-like protein
VPPDGSMRIEDGRPKQLDEVTFAVIGDYGINDSNERAVSRLVKSANPEFIVTTGDNTYGSNTPDSAIGKYYSDYVGNYKGVYGTGSEVNRFFPALGNHDWTDGGGIQAYRAYFTLPGNERYYDVTMGPVQFFIVDSDSLEPNGNTASSVQGQWLKAGLAASQTPWQVVVMHHAPYSSGEHGPSRALRWPYERWGADAVLSGHDHDYERLLKDDDGDGIIMPYFVNGAGGAALRAFSSSPDPDSALRYNSSHGAMLVSATDTEIEFEFRSISNSLIDTYSIDLTGKTITGTNADNVVAPTANVLALRTTSRNDTISTLAGDDTIDGGGGDDRLSGGRGDDRLSGGDGRDTLAGGLGDDRLSGGGGSDRFEFSRNYARDRIVDFKDDVDTIELNGTTLRVTSKADALSLATVVNGNTVFTFDTGDVLIVENIADPNLLRDDIAIV